MDISSPPSEPGKIESVKQESPEVPPYLRQVSHDMRVTDSQENESYFLPFSLMVANLESNLCREWLIMRQTHMSLFPLTCGPLKGLNLRIRPRGNAYISIKPYPRQNPKDEV